jgi:hypothetical protein
VTALYVVTASREMNENRKYELASANRCDVGAKAGSPGSVDSDFCDATQIATDETQLHGATHRYKGANRRGGGGVENFPRRNKTSLRRRVTRNPVAPL